MSSSEGIDAQVQSRRCLSAWHESGKRSGFYVNFFVGFRIFLFYQCIEDRVRRLPRVLVPGPDAAAAVVHQEVVIHLRKIRKWQKRNRKNRDRIHGLPNIPVRIRHSYILKRAIETMDERRRRGDGNRERKAFRQPGGKPKGGGGGRKILRMPKGKERERKRETRVTGIAVSSGWTERRKEKRFQRRRLKRLSPHRVFGQARMISSSSPFIHWRKAERRGGEDSPDSPLK